jgi:hypothetical protein
MPGLNKAISFTAMWWSVRVGTLAARSPRRAQSTAATSLNHWMLIRSGARGAGAGDRRGRAVLRQTIGIDALAKADPEALERLLGPLFRQLIEGDATN